MRDTVQNYSIGTFSWGSPTVFFVWGLPYSSNGHVTPVSVRGRKGLTCSIRAPPCPRFDTLYPIEPNYFWLCKCSAESNPKNWDDFITNN